MRLFGLVVSLAFTMVVPAAAAELEPGESPAVKLMRAALGADPNPIELRPVFTIKSDTLPLSLGETNLADIARQLGGEVNHAGQANGGLYWLCYTSPANGPTPATLFWFAARDRGDESRALSVVAAEPAPASPPAHCPALATPLSFVTNVPGYGVSYQTLVANFGTSDRDPTGVVAYTFPVTKAEENGNVRVPELKYALDGEKVVAVSFGEAIRRK